MHHIYSLVLASSIFSYLNFICILVHLLVKFALLSFQFFFFSFTLLGFDVSSLLTKFSSFFLVWFETKLSIQSFSVVFIDLATSTAVTVNSKFNITCLIFKVCMCLFLLSSQKSCFMFSLFLLLLAFFSFDSLLFSLNFFSI